MRSRSLSPLLVKDLDPSQWQASLYDVLQNFPPLNLLVNKTMKQAIPLLSLRDQIFAERY